MGAAINYRRTGFLGAAGVPAYLLPAPLRPGDARPRISLPQLPTTEAITIVLECDRPAQDGLFMLLGIADGQGGYTDVCYLQNYAGLPDGLAQNTYSSGFWTAQSAPLVFANGARVLVVVRLYRQQQDTRFSVFLNSKTQALTYTGSQVTRDWAPELVLGDTNGIPWNGTIYTAKVYLRALSDVVCRSL